jgi:hypothetical protein
MTPIPRLARVKCSGLELRPDDIVRVITRTGADDEVLAVLAEALETSSPVTVTDFEVLPIGDVVLPSVCVATLITARENDPDLWREVSA